MRTYQSGGTEIGYDSAGSGPTIVFLHNGGTSSTIWRHQVAGLSSRYRTIAVDLPGFGCSPRPPGGIDLRGQVELIASLLDSLAVKHALLVGNCMGSNIAATLAGSRPDLAAGLVLINPLTEATFSAGWLGLLHRMRGYAAGPTLLMRHLARRVVLPRPAAVVAVRFQLGAKGAGKRLHLDPGLLAANRRREQVPALIDVLDDLPAYGHLDCLPDGLAVPVCTIWGAGNRVLSPGTGSLLGDRMGAEVAAVLEGCGHLPMLEDPECVTSLIDDFARAHLPALASTREDMP